MNIIDILDISNKTITNVNMIVDGKFNYTIKISY